MQQLMGRLAGLDARQKIAAAAALVATLAMTALVASVGSRADHALLYAGLEPAAAGQVIAALEARGVAHTVRGGSILVPEDERDTLRMTLAAEGLPATGGAGYELLDGLSGFGTTSQMFDAAYWRAKEGELARTIVAGSRIRQARVHISAQATGAFARTEPASASVTVLSAAGGVDARQARALRFLVASAVPGLAPSDVAVIDSEGGVVEEPAEGGPTAGDARAEALRERAERLLEARVGAGNAIVEVDVDTVTEREQILERRLDPDSRVVISTDVEERSGTETGGGQVTVASNLPDGDAAEDGSQSQDSETRERVNYEVSEMTREVVREPGAIRRMTVAVLVDGVMGEVEGEPAPVPRGPEELAALRELVGSAVGLDEERGDTITIRSMPFEATEALAERPPEAPGLRESLEPMRLIQVAVAALVALVLGLFVLRPILAGRAGGSLPALPSAPGAGVAGAGGAAVGGLPGPAEVLAPGEGEAAGEAGLVAPLVADMDDIAFGDGAGGAGGGEDAERVRRMIEDHREETMEILRGWLEAEEEVA